MEYEAKVALEETLVFSIDDSEIQVIRICINLVS